MIRFSIMLVAGLAATAALASDSIWSPVASLPEGLAGSACGVISSRLVLVGGSRWEDERKITLREVQSYDPLTNRWEQLDASPQAFAHGPFCTWRNRILAWTADSVLTIAMDAPLGRVQARSLPHPVVYSGSTLLHDSFYILGGCPDALSTSKSTSQFFSMDLVSGSIEILPEFPGGPAIHIGLAASAGRLWAFTGGVWDKASSQMLNTDAAWVYDPLTRKWSSVAPVPYKARGVAVLALDDRHILLAGGYRNEDGGAHLTDACLIYDLETNQYHSLGRLPIAVMLASLARVDDWIYVLGGENGPRRRSANVYRAPLRALLQHEDSRS
ncbi:MAG: hypothetical protein HS122_17620 [Opitutaceae bacterium]|nr:hypothetical protein [Opitutaceae bacterium]